MVLSDFAPDNTIFLRQMPKEATHHSQKSYNVVYFEAARSLTNRSILSVCEDLANKADAERGYIRRFLFTLCRSQGVYTLQYES